MLHAKKIDAILGRMANFHFAFNIIILLFKVTVSNQNQRKICKDLKIGRKNIHISLLKFFFSFTISFNQNPFLFLNQKAINNRKNKFRNNRNADDMFLCYFANRIVLARR
jgi:hypothetical protein